MTSSIVEASNLESFFHETLTESVSSQNVDVCEETVVYLTGLLSQFLRSDELFERDEDGVRLQPLAVLYCHAASAPDRRTQREHLKKLGDLALFVSGWFARTLERRRVGVRYYIQMGETAYDCLSESYTNGVRDRVFAQIFQDLAGHFSELRDAISEIHTTVDTSSDSNLLGLYELWQRSGSTRAAERLREEGIHVLPRDDSPDRSH